ncbi:rhodanese-like domain-containing protein [Actinokineospora spheciospongiae]|uniref:rhodanese-like domain-containing protein n=1 Tax=Actinokineospora spheciospongiae TaxID=909613 RepID=UPI000D714470|nr:rhodanese-like domain-containing protein [Actinokineospora spheciospongiae]PWW62041.1 rhodanese-related sulfurtransferase [Actinokineospora spheciospongiae]
MTTPDVPTTTVADIPAELPEGTALLDVRERDEWDAGHAPGAAHIPMSELAGRLGDLTDTTYLVICRSGGRSARVTTYLNANGWEAANVDGGMQVWEAQGRPVVSDTDPTPRVI